MVYLSFYCPNLTCIEYQPEIRGARNFLKFNITHLQNFGQPEEAEDDVNLNNFLSPDMSYMSQLNNNTNANKNPTGGLHPPSIHNPQQFTPHNIQEVFNKINDLTNPSNLNSHLSPSSLSHSNSPRHLSFSMNEIESTTGQKEKEDESLNNTNSLSLKKQQHRTEVGFITSKRNSLNPQVDGECLEDKDKSMINSSRFETISARHNSLISFGRNFKVFNIIAHTLYRKIMCLSLRRRGLDLDIIIEYRRSLSSLMMLLRRNGMYS